MFILNMFGKRQSVEKLIKVINNMWTNIGKDLICEQKCINIFEAWQH
jgi:hypothetical protein